MYQLYPTITTTELRDNPSAIYKKAKESPVVVMSRATPKIVCVSSDEWNKIARLVEDQEDVIAALKVELAIALGEESTEEITDLSAFRAEVMGSL